MSNVSGVPAIVGVLLLLAPLLLLLTSLPLATFVSTNYDGSAAVVGVP